ncbi:MAG: energy-coupling factor ABC transporter ATP-binding protein [Anaerolineae bacterium]
MPREAAVIVEDLHFAYPPLQPGGAPIPVLRGVDLRVGGGECLAVMGPTGDGKTTLCLALNGLVPQATGGDFRGRVIVEGMDTREHTVAELSQQVGLVFQDAEAQLFSMTVEDEVAFGLESMGLPRPEMVERIAWALEVVRLTGLEDRSPLQLSGGQKKRLAIASVLAMRPPLLVLDEPTAGLDPVGKTEVLSVVETLRRDAETTVILVEQDPEVVAAFADRVVVLGEGRVVMEGSPRQVFPQVEAMHGLGLGVPQVSELAHTFNVHEGTDFRLLDVEEAQGALEVFFFG